MASKKSYINYANKYDRVVVLIDMDCFYCQVEEKLNPSLAGKPIAVVQYNAWQGGGIIAVNYPARSKGVTRHMRGEEAKEQCPEIELVRVPNIRGKADLTKYREAGKNVAVVLQSFTPLLERASVDEAYMDITEIVLKRLDEMNKGNFQLKPNELKNTFTVGYENFTDYINDITSNINTQFKDFGFEHDEKDLETIQQSDLKLLIGAAIVNEIRAKVKEETGYECSAGIAHNKILAKLACGINKPNKQTILPLHEIRNLFNSLPVRKVKGLGGKFGEDVCERLKIKCVGDLEEFSEQELQRKFDEKNGSWLYLICRGIDLEAVRPKFSAKSIGCCKKFPGRNCINGIKTLNHWLLELSKEVCDRMEQDEIENNRKAKQMVVSYIQEINGEDISSSRSTNMVSNDPEMLAKFAFEVIRKNTNQFLKTNNENVLNNSIKFLGISVGKFESTEVKTTNTLEKLFLNHSKKKSSCDSENINNHKNSSDDIPSEETESEITSTKSCFFTSYLKKSVETNTSNEVINSHIVENSTCLDTEPEVLSKTEPPKNSFFASYFRNHSNSCEEEFRNNNCKENNVTNDNTNQTETDNRNNKEEIKSFFLSVLEKENSNSKTNINQNLNCSSKIDIEPQPLKETQNNVDASHSNIYDLHTQTNNIDTPSTSENSLKVNCNNKNNTHNDYSKDYAEYAVPEPSESDYINCEKCGRKILSFTLQTHMDYHFALDISKQQRENYRQEFKLKIKSPPAKKIKSNHTSTTENDNNKKSEKKINAIEKFLFKKDNLKETTTNSNNNDDNELKEICTECGARIPIVKMLEHLDYHTAKKLQIELNSLTQKMQKSSTTSLSPKISTKKVVSKNISTYFSSKT